MHLSHSFLKPRTSKGILLGQPSVGKTALIQRIINNNFHQLTHATIGLDLLTADIFHNSQHFKLQLWDTAGQQKYKCMVPSYIKGAICVIFVFDLSKLQSLVKIESWISLWRASSDGGEGIELICGNKNDLAQDGRMNGELEKVLAKWGLYYFEVSAKTGEGVQKVVEYLGRRLEQLEEKDSLNNVDLKRTKIVGSGKEKKQQNSFIVQNEEDESAMTDRFFNFKEKVVNSMSNKSKCCNC